LHLHLDIEPNRLGDHIPCLLASQLHRRTQTKKQGFDNPLLCGATAAGLELWHRDGTWLPVPVIPEGIVVDSGDMLQWLTNGLVCSTTHRVVNPIGANESRYSLPFFVHPRPEVDLTPLPPCVARTGGVARFGSITAAHYLQQRLQEIGVAPPV